MSFEDLSKRLKFSRATYYRKRSILRDLRDDLVSIRRPPRRASISRKWSAAKVDLVLKIRRENPTYGKAKIVVTVISKLKRDHNFRFSENAVGCILNYLKDKGKITKSISAVRTKRKRNFKEHAKAFVYKRYEEMEMGEYVQIDHMTVTKNCVKKSEALLDLGEEIQNLDYSSL